jgi:hypothetical protein
MFALAMVLILDFLLNWGSLFFNIASVQYLIITPGDHRSFYHLYGSISNVILLLILLGKITLDLLYMSAFKARKWEKVLFVLIIVWSVIYRLTNWLFHKNIISLLSYLNLGFMILSIVFLTVFFSLRVRKNCFLLLLITGYIISFVTNLFSEKLYHFFNFAFEDYKIAFFFNTLIENLGSFFLLAFAFSVIFELRGYKKVRMQRLS